MSITPQTLASELLKKLTPTKFNSRPRNDLAPGQVEDLANFMVSPPNNGKMEIEDDIEDIEVPDYPDEGDNTDVSTPFKEVKAKAVWKKLPGGDFSSGKKNMLDNWLGSKGKASKESARKALGKEEGKGDMASVSSKDDEEKGGRKSLITMLGLKQKVESIEEEIEEEIEDDIEPDRSSGKKRNRLLIEAEQSEEERFPKRNLNEIWGDGDEDGKRKRSESRDEDEDDEDKKKQYKKVKKEKEGKVVEKKKSVTKSKSKKEESTVKKRKGAEEKAKAKKESKAKKQMEEDSEDEKPKSKAKQSKGTTVLDKKEQSGKKKIVLSKKKEEKKEEKKEKSTVKKKEDEKVKSSQKKKSDIKLVKGKSEKDSKGKKDKSTKEKAKKKKDSKDSKEKKVKKPKRKVSKKKKDGNGEDEADDEEDEVNDSEISRMLEGDDESDSNDDDDDDDSEEELPFTMVDGQYVFTGHDRLENSEKEEDEEEEEDEDEDNEDKPGSYWKKNVRRSSLYSSQKKQRHTQYTQHTQYSQYSQASPFGKASPLDQLKSSKKVMMFSGLFEDDASFLYVAAKKLGNFDIQTLPLPQMSHLIYDGNKRTIKVLYALAKRAWILEKSYAYASYEFGDWVPEKDHESPAFPSKKDRDTTGPLFKDTKFFLKSTNYQNIGLDELTVLIKLAGGIVCKRSSEAELVIENGEEKEDFMILEGEEEPIREQKKVLYKWILDSLSKYSRLPLSEYATKSGEEKEEKEKEDGDF